MSTSYGITLALVLPPAAGSLPFSRELYSSELTVSSPVPYTFGVSTAYGLYGEYGEYGFPYLPNGFVNEFGL